MMMNTLREPALPVDLQIIDKAAWVPQAQQLQQWVKLCLPEHRANSEICLRIVDADEITALNRDYRQQNKATNVLAFSYDDVGYEPQEQPFLGDIVICAAVLAQEARQQGKALIAHWAHLVIHGTLHLLGYDHKNEADAAIMETLEVQYLAQLGFKNPYKDNDR